MKYYVYKTTNLINGKIYIGYHASDNIESDPYIGSGTLFKHAKRKYGSHNFKREILFEFADSDSARAKEKELVNEEFVKLDTNYNINLGGCGARVCSDETKERMSNNKQLLREEISEIQKRIWANPEYKSKMIEIFNSETRIERLRLGIKKWISENQELHMERMLKINKNPEKIRKMADKHIGMKRTDVAKKNISTARFGKGKGPRNSEFKGYYITPIGKFPSLKDAATALNCSMIGVRDRCCIKNLNKITKFSVVTDKSGLIKDDMIGKTWNESGWSFEPKVN